jgi:hypothetical protein
LVHNLILSLSAEEIAAGNEAHAFFERYSTQISAIKRVAEQQKASDFAAAEAERRKAKGKGKMGTLTDNPMESEKDAVKDDEEGTDTEGGDEEEAEPAPAKRPMRSKPKRLAKKSMLVVVSDGEEAGTSKVCFLFPSGHFIF